MHYKETQSERKMNMNWCAKRQNGRSTIRWSKDEFFLFIKFKGALSISISGTFQNFGKWNLGLQFGISNFMPSKNKFEYFQL